MEAERPADHATITDRVEEVQTAAAYFSALQPRKRIKVVESDTAPKSYIAGLLWAAVEGSEREPLGQRILELPDDLQVFESRDPRSTFTAYVPVGSLAKGEALVAKGGLGKTVACAPCHGSDLKGLEPLPSIAGRSPSYMFRQLYDFRHGARTGEWSPLMAQVVSNLDQEDMLAIVAYLASIGDRLGKTDHQARRQAAGDGSAARAALIVGHLSDDIALREAGEVGVFRPSRPIRAMTKPACEQVRLTAVGNDVRQWPMVARIRPPPAARRAQTASVEHVGDGTGP